ncbi:MAG: proline--tRNA ligase [Firmicutes bacterium HGW-Firmicutes-12]|nr:MAG: proline--tRNA ligase [Firmicutes bacterium HGW-Firmicutes-12]
MYFSKLYAPTLREIPAEAEVASHKLLVRAGYIRKSSSGVYTYMPLAQRVLQKISTIIREEMNKAGGQEVMLPIIQPAEIWLESGRWNVYGKELFRLKDRHDRDFCLGPTHEEVITDLVRMDVSSYRQLPLMLYQIQNKYRDERRPRFGLLRGREFIMKDLYSFDREESGLEESYQKMYDAYTAVFTRCGLEFRPVEADSGAIGGSSSHEFMVIADSGEAAIVYCPECSYAANVEIAPCYPAKNEEETPLLLEKKLTPNKTSIDDVATYLGEPASKLIKTLFFQADDEVIAVLVRGDRTVNEIKIQGVQACVVFEMAAAEKIKEATGCEPGYVGPIGLKKDIKIYADEEIKTMVNAVCGANESNHHWVNVVPGRDFTVSEYTDLRLIEEGESCPKCGVVLNTARGIEVGQVFKLGTKYSNALKATYVDEKGQENDIVMGCYGIGVSRTMAAAVEQNHDDNGIIWPVQIAPYQVVIVPVSTSDQQIWQAALLLYQELTAVGIEVIMDDRDERAGVKFKDADLIGYPIRVTIGKRYIEENKMEIKKRWEKESSLVAKEEIIEIVKKTWQDSL